MNKIIFQSQSHTLGFRKKNRVNVETHTHYDNIKDENRSLRWNI